MLRAPRFPQARHVGSRDAPPSAELDRSSVTMKYRKLGNSGLSVSNFILGTLEFGTATSYAEAVDLYQMHGWDPLTPVEETLSFLDAAARAGKIHYVGLSNFTCWQLQYVLSTPRSMGLQVPITLQQQYSLVCREIEYEVIPA